MSNFYTVLEQQFANSAEQDCLRLANGEVWTYADLTHQVERMAATLAAQRVQAGDRVVVQVEKSPHNLALYLAVLKIGAVYVPLNTAYTRGELDYFIADAQPSLFIGDTSRDDVPSLTLSAQGSGSLLDNHQGREAPPTATRASGDIAAILYTSGTTGRSKGAMLTHENLRSNAYALTEAWRWRQDDVLLHALPIFHVHGLFIASHCALLNGSAMEFLPKFEVGAVLDALPRCSVMMGVPTFYSRLLADTQFRNVSVEHMRVFICGSAPLTESVFQQWYEVTGQKILERYGMSETIINTTNPLDGDRVPATVGFALPGLALRIADEQGTAVATGEIGTIEVRGPNVFSGYWRMPEKTAEEFRDDGYFITGDLGTMDEQGRVSIVGRAKDLVISGGYNVYPKEIERVLDELPGIAESAVIGVPHPDFGEAVVAVVVPSEGELTLQDIEPDLADQLARFKQPKALINLAELPRNTMGKVQKNLLREQHARLFV